MKKIFHIANDYYGTKVYNLLFLNLKNLKIFQEVFVVLRKDQLILLNKIDKKKFKLSGINIINYNLNFLFSTILRFMIGFRSKMLANFLIKNNLIDNNKFIHAHTWFSAGGIAYFLNKKIQIKYAVAIRNVDINYIYKIFIHQRRFGYSILTNAHKIIFISNSTKHKLFSYLKSKPNLKKLIEKKSLIIPNGIDDFWIKNTGFPKKINNKKDLKLLYVGEINPNKSIELIIDVTEKLMQDSFNLELTIIGSTKPGYFKSYYNLINKRVNSNTKFKMIPHVDDKQKLLNFYKNSDIFIMPSKYETFGLVYIEAMSQGTPVLYTKNQAIDGYFKKGNVGYSVDRNVDDIIHKIKLIIKNYNFISSNCIKESKKFSWERIASNYKKIY